MVVNCLGPSWRWDHREHGVDIVATTATTAATTTATTAVIGIARYALYRQTNNTLVVILSINTIIVVL